MKSEWRKSRIGDIGRVVTGKTPSTSRAENFGGPYPFITIPDLNKGREVRSTERSISETGASGMASCLLPPNAVLMTCIATIGKVGITTKPSFTNQQINAVVCGPDVLPSYLYYVFSQLGKDLESAGGGGSVFTNVSKSRFSDIEIPVPSIQEQTVMCSLVGCLDDRITLLRETNTTLEAIAQALFKSWFIDFDPVHAKMQGQAPQGMDEATAALFPDSFEESELGPIPKGWAATLVSEVSEIVKGKSYSSKDLENAHTTALVTLKSFERGGGFRMDGFKPYSGNYKPSQIVTAGDLIIAYTDVTQNAELIGKPAIVITVEEYETLVASLDVGIIRPNTLMCGRQFLYG